MGKGKPRAVEKGVLGQFSTASPSGALNIPQGPVYYPTEEEFKDPLDFIYKIRPEAEPYGICRIVPPKGWKPPFALDLDSFTFPTKTQAIHQLQARSAACDPETFELEYGRFLENHCGKKSKKKLIFEGEELDLCKLFNAVKRYGGYDKAVKEKKWGEIFRFVRSAGKISECSKHVLCQLYREHLYDYEKYNNQLNGEKATRKCKRGAPSDKNQPEGLDVPSSKRIRRNPDAEAVKVVKLKKEEEFDQICEQCRSGLHGEVMLLCDRCNRGWHIYCLSPPLKIVPPGNWYCLECLNSDKDSFGFVPGKRFSLESFRRLAERAKRKWFRSACVSRLQAEKKFWEIVEGSLGEVEVMYGSDLDTSLYGSGFPRVNDPRPPSVEVEVWDEYSSSPWNLNNLPKLKGSMLRAVHDNIAGVMVPWLYIGMLFSSFCWHFEDHCFYSMNYLHWGEPKCWYSVPGSEAESFEKVMRNSLPDLFDAQPDLLFQLVTMLNPSVLQKNGVPVYTVLQEAGNFVITFPKSFHGGFNFGFNCAEAVNFAPADWLPHGGFGAQLYKLYRKAAVLSHEELLCVVAKTEYDSKVSAFLRKELLRVISKEKTWRERLWKNGIFSSSVMSPRKHPEFVGTEEDPTCIICQQHLYLSAVVCRCRPSSFVCLEHWEHLCECHPRKHHLLYRHTLAELNDLVLMTDRSKEKTQSRNIRRQLSCSNESSAITKKVKGGHMTHAQLAEEWLLGSCKILQIPYSGDAFKSALKQAEQFLWAGPEMNAVRDMTENLHEAMKWAEDVRDCLLKVVDWSHHDNEAKKVSLEDVNSLLNFDPLPCNEPGQSKLKVYAEEARSLVGEINSALSTCSLVTVAELEVLESRCSRLPLYLEERERLTEVISSAKVWIDKVKRCIAEKKPAAIEVDIIQKLKSEMSGLQVQLPEMEILLDLLRHVESWQIRCHEILDKPISLKKLEVFLQESDNFTISIPELKLLRQHYCDAMSWISRLRGVLVNIQERDDQENVVEELTCLLKAGKLLHVQVDELPFVEVELKKAYCRVKALKVQARGSQMSLDSIKQLMTEAIMLQIEHENTFMDMSGVLAAAISWEERAKHVLNNMALMSEFEDVIRKSEHIFVILPSLHDVKDAVAVAKSWRRRCQPFMISALPDGHMPSSLLKVDLLKELVFDSKLLRISLEEPVILKKILRNCEKWEDEANSVLELVESLLNICDIDTPMIDGLIEKIDQLLMTIKSSRAAGLSLGFSFHEIPKLQDACCTLQWCLEALYLCCSETSLEEVEGLLEDFEHLPGTFASSSLRSSLIEGVRWLKKAMEVISMPSNETRCRLSDVEEVLEEAQRTRFSFHLMVGRLVDAIGKHKSWQEQVHVFFNPTLGEQSWSQLLQLKELGISDAFRSPELDTVLSEVEKVEQWLLQCEDIFALSNGDVNPLSTALIKVKHTLDRSLNIYNETNGCKVRGTCVCCCSETEDQILACSQCKDWYHISCLTPALVDKYVQEEYVCPYCVFFENGAILGNAGRSVIYREKHPELKMLRGLLSDANGFHVWIEERDIAAQLVERALACKMCLKEIVDQALDYLDEDLSSITERLKTALKAVAVAGVYDHQGCYDLELALSQNAWKIRVKKLLDGSQKPLIQQIQRLLKEGLQMNIPSDEHFMQKLAGVKNMGMHWADNAKKVALDSGALGLDEVFKLIKEGENLPVHFEKELKLLKDRSVLYCICRKPNDQRAMIACDCCDEWYHLDCINLPLSLPKVYICPACKPITDEFTSPSLLVSQEERSSGAKCEPQTPPQHTKSKTKKPRKSRSNLQRRMMVAMDLSSILKNYSGFDRLLWRNKKPFRRAARKRAQLENLSPFFHTQQ